MPAMRGWLAVQVRGWGALSPRISGSRTPARMIWTTQRAWPSTMWNFLSRDYDAQSSFFDTTQALEPVHARLNLKAG
jgi:hypothetical protein